MNSANDDVSLDGLAVADAKARIVEWLDAQQLGASAITYKLRDWLFSRQRYWGEPFPIVYDEAGRAVALPESMLPVELPEIDDFEPRILADDDTALPEPPLARAEEWVTVELDLGDGPRTYRRETNTMPQWAGSCWYYLRYLDPTNGDALVDPANERYWMVGNGSRRRRRHRPLRRWRRARGAAPPLRALLAQGAVRPRPRVDARSRSTACSTRAPSPRPPTPTTAARTSRPPRCRSATARGSTPTATRSCATTARWARA